MKILTIYMNVTNKEKYYEIQANGEIYTKIFYVVEKIICLALRASSKLEVSYAELISSTSKKLSEIIIIKIERNEENERYINIRSRIKL